MLRSLSNGIVEVDLMVTSKSSRKCGNDTPMLILVGVDAEGTQVRLIAFDKAHAHFEPRVDETKAYKFCNVELKDTQYGNTGKEIKLTLQSNVMPIDAFQVKIRSENLSEVAKKAADSRVDVMGVLTAVDEIVDDRKRRLVLADPTSRIEIMAYNDAARADTLTPGSVCVFKRAKVSSNGMLHVFDPPDVASGEDATAMHDWYKTDANKATAIGDLNASKYGALFTVEGKIVHLSDVIELASTKKRTMHLHDTTGGIEVSLFGDAMDTAVGVGASVRVVNGRLTNWNGLSIACQHPLMELVDSPYETIDTSSVPFLSTGVVRSAPRVVSWSTCTEVASMKPNERCSLVAQVQHDGVQYALADSTGEIAVRFHNVTTLPPIGSVVAVRNAKRLDVGVMIYSDTPVSTSAAGDSDAPFSSVEAWVAERAS